jgi:hypothetical protein
MIDLVREYGFFRFGGMTAAFLFVLVTVYVCLLVAS